MATREDALNWMYSKVGQSLDFDGQYGAQCFDYFNYYYEYLTGRNPYADGYGVPGAKDIWSVPTDLFTKIANDPTDPNQLPQTGDILIYNATWGAGYGHVEMVLSADQNGVNVSAQNSQGPYVDDEFRPWERVVGGLIGWLSFNGFTDDTPAPAPEPEPSQPQPETPNEPPQEPAQDPTPVETPPADPAPTPVPPVQESGTPGSEVSKPSRWAQILNVIISLIKKLSNKGKI